MISKEEDIVIFSDAAFRAADGKASHGFSTILRGSMVNAGALQVQEFSSKKAEASAILVALRRSKERGFLKVCVLSYCLEVVQALNGDFD